MKKPAEKAIFTMKTLKLQYFAAMRDFTGSTEEMLQTTAVTPEDVWIELVERYQVNLKKNSLKVVVNDEFADWTTTLDDGDSLVYLPPVAGG